MLENKPLVAQEILKNWPDGLIGLDHYGNITFSNEKASAILGWSVDEFAGRNAHDLLCSKAVDYVHDAHECPMCKSRKDSEKEVDYFEAWWIGAQGVYMNLDVRILAPDVNDLDVAAILMFTECASGTVSQYEARRLAMFAEYSPVPILEIALPMSIEFANPAMTDLMVEYGFNNDGIPNVLPSNIENLVADTADMQKTLINQEVEYADVAYMWTLNPLIKNNKQFVQVFGLDVTELRKAQNELEDAKNIAERANEAKSHFLANMSHEIRTPMNAIVGFTEILLKTPLNDKQSGYCQKIKISSTVLLEVINDILDFSKIEAGKLNLEKISFNLIENIEVLADLFADRAHEAGVELVFDIDQRLPAMVTGDSLRFKQVMINLVSNAIKFTRKGYIEVIAKPVRVDEKNCRIRMEIKDTGKGIPKDKQAKLFAPFTQEDESTTRKYGGTGLGLSICRSLVELMGGQIGVRSKEGQGSVFYFEANFGVVDSVSVLERQLQHFKIQNERKQILLLLQDRVILRSVRNQLIAYGLEPQVFEDGVALVDEFEWAEKHHEILAVITDTQEDTLQWISDLSKAIQHKNGDYPFILGVTQLSVAYPWPASFEWPEERRLSCEKPVKPSILCRSILMKSAETNHFPGKENEVTAVPKRDSLQGFQILIVDDNLFNRQLVLELLEDTQAELDTADDGQAAVAKVDSKSYDFILMDIQMPIMDGYEATKIIKGKDPHQIVIALTANAIKGDRERFLSNGFDDYISKPVDTQKLHDLIYFWADKVAGKNNKKTEKNDSRASKSSTSSEQLSSISSEKSEILKPEIEAESQLDFTELPEEFRGLKVSKALKMIGDKRALYLKLMMIFKKNYGKSAQDLLIALQDEDALTAGRLVHTIKGSASNLGAESLRKVAYELEEAITNNTESLQENVSEFCAQLDDTILIMEDFLDKYKHLGG